VRYRELIIGTDLAAATRPLKSRASGNKYLAAAGRTLPSAAVVIHSNVTVPASRMEARRAETSRRERSAPLSGSVHDSRPLR
jgi:hypothetical protein